MPIHVVSEGECISSIAFAYGFAPGTIWKDAANSALREVRTDPNILAPGDEIAIPVRTAKRVAAATGRKHTFRRNGVPALLRLQLFRGDKPRAWERWSIDIDGVVLSGETDQDGVLTLRLPPDAASGELLIGDDRFRARILFGRLDPIETLAGVRARLTNLGFPCGFSGDPADELLREQLQRFQERFSLPVTSEPDDATRAKLVALHDTRGDLPPARAAGSA
jgi:hypothetical protein